MPLEYLELRNFQNHKNMRLEFDPGANSIVGPSDVGKSAIIRALQWIAYNKPSGDAFIRHGQTKCRVRLGVDDRVVTRYRDQSTNSYEIDGEDKMVSFGTKVPKPIQSLLNIGPINLQQQHDPPFWFSAPASEVSKSLNAIVDLGGIDASLGWLTKYLNARASDAAFAQATLNESQAIVDKQPNKQAIEEGLLGLERLEAKIVDNATNANVLGTAIRKIESAKKRRAEAEARAKHIDGVLVDWHAAVLAKQHADELGDLIRSAETQIDLMRSQKLAPLDELEKAFAAANGAVASANDLGRLLSWATSAQMKLGNALTVADTRKRRLEEEQAAMREEIERENRKCQTCGQDLPF